MVPKPGIWTIFDVFGQRFDRRNSLVLWWNCVKCWTFPADRMAGWYQYVLLLHDDVCVFTRHWILSWLSLLMLSVFFQQTQDLFLYALNCHRKPSFDHCGVSCQIFACELGCLDCNLGHLSWLIAPTSCLRAGLAFWSRGNPRLPQHIPPFDFGGIQRELTCLSAVKVLADPTLLTWGALFGRVAAAAPSQNTSCLYVLAVSYRHHAFGQGKGKNVCKDNVDEKLQ